MVQKIYIYVVSFATLMMVIGGGIGVFSSIANLVAPTYYYMNFTDYVQNYQETFELTEGKENKSQADIKVEYERYIEDEKAIERATSVNGLIHSLGWVLIPLPVFLYMQRRLRNEAKAD